MLGGLFVAMLAVMVTLLVLLTAKSLRDAMRQLPSLVPGHAAEGDDEADEAQDVVENRSIERCWDMIQSALIHENSVLRRAAVDNSALVEVRALLHCDNAALLEEIAVLRRDAAEPRVHRNNTVGAATIGNSTRFVDGTQSVDGSSLMSGNGNIAHRERESGSSTVFIPAEV